MAIAVKKENSDKTAIRCPINNARGRHYLAQHLLISSFLVCLPALFTCFSLVHLHNLLFVMSVFRALFFLYLYASVLCVSQFLSFTLSPFHSLSVCLSGII